MALPSIKNSVGMAVTAVASSGVGTITLGSALSGGYQTAATAYGANANIDIRIEEGDTWEVCRDCTYTHSGTTVTRGTLEDGSSGTSTRVAFTSAAKVYVVESAERLRRTVGGYLEHSSHDGTAAVTGVVGTMHVFTGLTADRDFTLPNAAAVGDRIGVSFPEGSTSYEILLKTASGDKINTVDCSTTEWSRLFVAGEAVIFRCIDASTVDWVVDYDGRIGQLCQIELTTQCDGETAGTYTRPTQASTPGAWTVRFDNANCALLSSDAIVVRRTGRYRVAVGHSSKDLGVFGEYLVAQAIKNGSGTVISSCGGVAPLNALVMRLTGTKIGSLSTDDYVQYQYRTQNGNLGCSAVPYNFLELEELL